VSFIIARFNSTLKQPLEVRMNENTPIGKCQYAEPRAQGYKGTRGIGLTCIGKELCLIATCPGECLSLCRTT
jgi:hypothetical protein